MGYTHYFRPDNCEVIDPKAIEIIEKLLKEGFEANILCEEFNLPSNPPVVTESLIRFNGLGENGNETFLYQQQSGKEYSGFCKTARKPYDIYVQKVLLTLKHFHPDMELDSDGDLCAFQSPHGTECDLKKRDYACTYSRDWKEACDWASETLDGLTPEEREEEAEKNFDYEPSESDLEELADQIKRGFTSGRLDGEGYGISWGLSLDKFPN